jgi:tRNA(Ile)-lysidine synthase
VSRLVKEAEANIRERRLFRRGQAVLVAVSGGVDSMVLLDVLCQLAKSNDWKLTVAHLNHQLRGRSSTADEQLVRQTARRLKVPVVVERAKVREFARENKLSIEMAARKLRHEFLARTASRLRIPTVALAHHADDQVELFFLRLLRGGGGQGVAGMKWQSKSPNNSRIRLARPLLDQTKAALREHAIARKIRFREDATNDSLKFQRNRIRHELIPLLRRDYQPALDKTILRVMEIVGAESECVGFLAQEWIAAKSRVGFEELHVAIQRRCLQEQLLRRGVTPSYELIEDLRLNPKRLVSVGRRPGDGSLPHSFVLRESNGIIQVQRLEPAQFRTESKSIRLKGRAGRLAFGGLAIQWRLQTGEFLGLPKRRAASEVFDAEKVGNEITLRHWKPGDRFQPIGMKSGAKLQDLFTNARIPASERKGLVIAATAQGEIFWVERLRISERYKLSEGTIRRLQWRWHRL